MVLGSQGFRVLGLKCRCSKVLGSSDFRVLRFQCFGVLAF